ncbi:MAG: GTPase [Myxococcota bacterium]
MTRDPLVELLHRCHRDELLPLARLLRVNPTGLGLGDLARVLAQTLRRAGSHGLGNIVFRKGEGRPYRDILADVARERGIECHDLAETELAVLRAWFAARWEKLDGDARAELWARLELPGPAPAAGSEALASAESRIGPGFGYRISRAFGGAPTTAVLTTIGGILMHPVGCLFRPFFAIAAPALIWWQLRPDHELVVAAVLEVARLRQAVLHRVTIGVVGSPSTGKDAAVRALFGFDSGNISPIAGSTKEVSIQRLPGATALYVVNTPGLGDVVERVTEEARQVLDHIDVYLYVVNAEGGVQARELADYRACVATGKPVLACVNKIDVLRPRDKDRYLADARQKLGAAEEDFVPVAFDPLPELSPGPIGLEAVHAWLARKLLELGKDPAELPALPAR